MDTTLNLIYSEANHSIYTFTDYTVALAVITGLNAAHERAYFRTDDGIDISVAGSFETTATIRMVDTVEAAVLAYASIAGARKIS